LNVSYTLGGSATPGVDYEVSQAGLPAPAINFPAGSASASVTVTPLASTNIAGPQDVVITLGAGASYAVGAPGTATISLAGNNVPLASVQMNDGSPTFTWASESNVMYRAYLQKQFDRSGLALLPAQILPPQERRRHGPTPTLPTPRNGFTC
jgi:hypothetical protein